MKLPQVSLVIFSLMAFAGCASPASDRSEPVSSIPVIDGHADFAIHYMRRGWSVDAHDLARALPGQADLPRWRAGGVVGALVTVGSDLPPDSQQHFPRVLASLDWLFALLDRHAGAIALARSASEFDVLTRQGRFALIAAIEGGDQIDRSLDNLRTAYARGVRSMIIVYDHHNAIGAGAMAFPDAWRTAATPDRGLTAFGRQVVAEMNRLGMIVDLSHAAEATALEAIHTSRAPVIFSHSGAQALARTERNLSDEVIRTAAERGGLVMVPLVPYLSTTEHWNWWIAGEREYAGLKARHGDEAAVSAGMARWDAANPQPKVTIGHVADQIDHVARVAGRDHVAIGSDLDGMGSFAIEALKDASMLPALFAELRRRGWNNADLQKLGRDNFLRVMKAVEAAADSPR